MQTTLKEIEKEYLNRIQHFLSEGYSLTAAAMIEISAYLFRELKVSGMVYLKTQEKKTTCYCTNTAYIKDSSMVISPLMLLANLCIQPKTNHINSVSP